LELNLIRLLIEYPQKTVQVENEKILDYFLQPELKDLGEKIVETYKLLGFVDINVLLTTDEQLPLREKIFKLMMEAPPDDALLEKNFNDNVRRIKEKWYKDQHRQLKFKLAQAQENGNEELSRKLLYEKEKILTQEKELR